MVTKGYKEYKYYKDVQWVTRGYMGIIRGSMAVKRGYKG